MRSSGFGSRNRGQAQVPPSHGIRGAVKNRLVEDMFNCVQGQFKVLVVDRHATSILNAAMRMHELLDHGVTLVEDLYQTRQPLPQSPVIYFVHPNSKNMEAIKRDWERTPPYKNANIFFTSTAPKEIIQTLAGTSLAEHYLPVLKDLLIDFQAPESVMYSMNLAFDLTHFYGRLALEQSGQSKLDGAATQLTSVLVTLGEKEPIIRYQDNLMCQRVGRRVQELIGPITNLVSSSANAISNDVPATVLIVDRSVDMIAPFIHEQTYQAMIMDLCPLGEGGVYKYSYEERGGNKVEKTSVIDEEDSVWTKYRHEVTGVAVAGIADDFKRLIEENPQFADEKMGRAGGAGQMGQLADAVRQLPKFQEMKAKYSLHSSIAEDVLAQYKNHYLRDICDLEQQIATGEDDRGHKSGFKDLLKSLEAMLKERKISREIKLRLIILFLVVYGAQIPQDKRQSWLHDAGFGSSENHDIDILKYMNVVTSKEAAKSGTANGQFGGSKNAKKARRDEDTLNRYENTLKILVESIANNSLDEKLFPTVGGAAPSRSGSRFGGGPGAATAGATRTTLRSSTTPKFASAVRGGTTHSSGSDRILDLGHGKKIPLATGEGRIVVCVLGGMTYGEVRGMYEVIEKTKREVIFGGSNIVTPDTILQQLPAIEETGSK